MGYTVEISFDIRKHGSFSETKHEIISIAESNNCDFYYVLHEMEGDIAILRNHCIITCNFNDIENCLEFLKIIKKSKKIYIECVYCNKPRFKIIYASSYYKAKKMSKFAKINYKKKIRSEEEELFLKII